MGGLRAALFRVMTSVLFDLDGVLVDSRVAITTSLNHALTESGIGARPPADLYGFIGPALADVFAELLDEPRESEHVVACVTRYRAHYREESLRSTTLAPGVGAMLREIGASRRLGIAS